MLKQLLRAVPVAMAASLAVPAMAPTVVVHAQTVDQQQQHVDDIVNELEHLEEQADKITEDYTEAIGSKKELDGEIADAEDRIAEKQGELDTLRKNLSDMALRSFVGGGGTPLGPLFEDSSNLNASLQREELAGAALDVGNVTTDELNALVADLDQERNELSAKRDQAQQLADQLVADKAATQKKTAEYTKARADAEAKLGDLIAQEEARRAAESQRQLEAQIAAQAAQSNSGNSNSGGGNSNSSSNSNSNSSSNSNSNSSSNSNSNSGNSHSSSGNSNSGSSSSGGGSSSSGGGGGSAPAVSSRSGIAVQAALGQQGVPYRYATSKPGVSFDCSGLTAYAWAQAGVSLPHQSRAQYASVPHVSKTAAQPGDLIFFYSPISHVSIYLGNGMEVHAPRTGDVVKISSVNWNKVTGVGRPG